MYSVHRREEGMILHRLIRKKKTNVDIIASDIEFICLVKSLLNDGPISMAELRTTYSMLQKNGVHNRHCKYSMKKKLVNHIDDIHFMKPKRRNESEQVFTTALRDVALEKIMTQSAERDIRQLYESASILRKAMKTRQDTHGSLRELLVPVMPKTMYQKFCILSSDGYFRGLSRVFRLKQFSHNPQ